MCLTLTEPRGIAALSAMRIDSFTGLRRALHVLVVVVLGVGAPSRAAAQGVSDEPDVTPVRTAGVVQLESTCADAEFFYYSKQKRQVLRLPKAKLSGIGTFTVLAFAPDCESGSDDIILTPNTTTKHTIKQTPWPTLTIRGREDCALPEGTQIQIVASGSGDKAQSIGQIDQSISLHLPRGKYDIELDAPLHSTITHKDVEVGASGETMEECLRPRPATVILGHAGAAADLVDDVVVTVAGKVVAVPGSVEVPSGEAFVVEIRAGEDWSESAEFAPLQPDENMRIEVRLPLLSLKDFPASASASFDTLQRKCNPPRLGVAPDAEACVGLATALLKANEEDANERALEELERACTIDYGNKTSRETARIYSRLACVLAETLRRPVNRKEWRSQAAELCRMIGPDPERSLFVLAAPPVDTAPPVLSYIRAAACLSMHTRDIVRVYAGNTQDEEAPETGVRLVLGNHWNIAFNPLSTNESVIAESVFVVEGIFSPTEFDDWMSFAISGWFLTWRVGSLVENDEYRTIGGFAPLGLGMSYVFFYPRSPIIVRATAAGTAYIDTKSAAVVGGSIGFAPHPSALLEFGIAASYGPVRTQLTTLAYEDGTTEEQHTEFAGWRPALMLQYSGVVLAE
jgi:hypothetical protein